MVMSTLSEFHITSFRENSETSNPCFVSFQLCTPANTPATPPNFPDALTALSKLTTTEKFGNAAYATSPTQLSHSPKAMEVEAQR